MSYTKNKFSACLHALLIIGFFLTMSASFALDTVTLSQAAAYLAKHPQLPGGCKASGVYPHQNTNQLLLKISDANNKTIVTTLNSDGTLLPDETNGTTTWYYTRSYSERIVLPPFYKNLRDHLETLFNAQGSLIQLKSIIWVQKIHWLTRKPYWVPQQQIVCGG